MSYYIVTKVVKYKYHVEAKNRKDALNEVRIGCDPYDISVTSERVVKVPSPEVKKGQEP